MRRPASPSARLLRYAITNVHMLHTHTHKPTLNTCWVATVLPPQRENITRRQTMIISYKPSSKVTDSMLEQESRVFVIVLKSVALVNSCASWHTYLHIYYPLLWCSEFGLGNCIDVVPNFSSRYERIIKLCENMHKCSTILRTKSCNVIFRYAARIVANPSPF